MIILDGERVKQHVRGDIVMNLLAHSFIDIVLKTKLVSFTGQTVQALDVIKCLLLIP